VSYVTPDDPDHIMWGVLLKRERDEWRLDCARSFELASKRFGQSRGRKPVRVRLGMRTTNDGYGMVAPRPEGTQAAAAMHGALRMASLRPEDVRVVNAHGSATPLNDGTESRVIRSVLGSAADDVAVIGTKPYHGHALGASGAIEAVVTCLALETGWLPPILNLETPGEDCDLDYVLGEGRAAAPGVTLSNSFGFGGINACLAFAPPGARA